MDVPRGDADRGLQHPRHLRARHVAGGVDGHGQRCGRVQEELHGQPDLCVLLRRQHRWPAAHRHADGRPPLPPPVDGHHRVLRPARAAERPAGVDVATGESPAGRAGAGPEGGRAGRV